MPKRMYVGAHRAVEVEVDGQAVFAARGVPFEVGEGQAAEMDESDAWSKVPASKSKEKE